MAHCISAMGLTAKRSRSARISRLACPSVNWPAQARRSKSTIAAAYAGGGELSGKGIDAVLFMLLSLGEGLGSVLRAAGQAP